MYFPELEISFALSELATRSKVDQVITAEQIAAGFKLGTIRDPNSKDNEHLHFQVKHNPDVTATPSLYRINPSEFGPGLSMEANPSNPQNVFLKDVMVGGRLFQDYDLARDPRSGNPLETPILADPSLALLPFTDPDSRFAFEFSIGDFNVGRTLPIYIDPAVAIGYEFLVFSGPRIRSVILPSVGDDAFTICIYDDTLQDYICNILALANIPFDFGPDGASKFLVLGIEPSAALDPSDTQAFVTGLTFVESGQVQLFQTPLTTEVPEPPLLGLVLLTGFAVFYSSKGSDTKRKLWRMMSHRRSVARQ